MITLALAPAAMIMLLAGVAFFTVALLIAQGLLGIGL
jgi:hypothetical protein